VGLVNVELVDELPSDGEVEVRPPDELVSNGEVEDAGEPLKLPAAVGV
jgi:hypothetical protein